MHNNANEKFIESFICIQCSEVFGNAAILHYDLCASCGEEQWLDAMEDEDEQE